MFSIISIFGRFPSFPLIAMKNKHLLFLCMFSLILSVTMCYLDEARYSFSFLLNPTEVFVVFFYAGLISILPIVFFAVFSATKLKQYALFIALIGYAPVLTLIGFILYFQVFDLA